jgi:hypothetical protein
VRKNVLIHSILSSVSLNVVFRRILDVTKWDAWMQQRNQLIMVQLNDELDMFVWKFTYEDLMNSHSHFPTRYLWKLKILLKIKIFMRFLSRKVLLIKDNLINIQ